MYKNNSFIRNLAFFVILTTLSAYLVFLYLAFLKIYSGFIMQFIFFFDRLKHHQNPLSLLSSDYLLSLIAGTCLTYLLFLFFNALFRLVYQIRQTSVLISRLNIIKSTPQFFIFESAVSTVFTAGIFRPRIYISSRLLSVSPEELKAILLHETYHQRLFDPLRDCFMTFLRSALPYFPAKDQLFDRYQALIEVSCDRFAQSHLLSQKPLVSALLRVVDTNTSDRRFNLSLFSAQSERIHVLVGRKKLNVINFFAYNSFLVSFIFLMTVLVSKSTVFYDCQHLIRCFEVLLSPTQSALDQKMSSTVNRLTLHDSCIRP